MQCVKMDTPQPTRTQNVGAAEGGHAVGFAVVIVVLVMMILFAILLSQVDTKKLKSTFDKLKLVMKDRDVRVRFRILLAYFQVIGSFTSVEFISPSQLHHRPHDNSDGELEFRIYLLSSLF